MRRAVTYCILFLAPWLLIAGVRVKGTRNLKLGAQPEAACVTKASDGETDNGDAEFTSAKILASRFTLSADTTLCTVEVRMDNHPVPMFVQDELMDVSVWTHNTDKPGSIVGSWSEQRDSSIIGGDAFYEFTLTTALTAGTYWILVRAADNDVDAILQFDNSGEAGKDLRQSDDGGSTWTTQETSATFHFRINGR